MTAEELADSTRGVENIRLRDTRPLTSSQQHDWDRSRRGPGRRKAASAKAARVFITIKPELLAAADAYAAKKGMTRAELFARGLASVLPSRRAGA